MRLAVVGSRDFLDYAFLEARLCEAFALSEVEEIISGGARGVDSLAARFASEHNIPLKVFPADWTHLGRRAGPARNRDIVARADTVAAFWDGCSRGTQNTLLQAQRAEKRVVIFPIPPAKG
ncbi:DUF2493 domain-containing protein [uncultured Mailhella sp.]|uniref:DUF2493 domain-containing protein n=1 Tax=uncultured Mailhella sp. TaxID=1981031 RepID=UPI00263A3AA1|nr:DUF2493 domain-containing protein [uncultured Mailhella sp.]